MWCCLSFARLTVSSTNVFPGLYKLRFARCVFILFACPSPRFCLFVFCAPHCVLGICFPRFVQVVFRCVFILFACPSPPFLSVCLLRASLCPGKMFPQVCTSCVRMKPPLAWVLLCVVTLYIYFVDVPLLSVCLSVFRAPPSLCVCVSWANFPPGLHKLCQDVTPPRACVLVFSNVVYLFCLRAPQPPLTPFCLSVCASLCSRENVLLVFYEKVVSGCSPPTHTHAVTNRTHTYTHTHLGVRNNHKFLRKCFTFTPVFHELCQGVETDTTWLCTPTHTHRHYTLHCHSNIHTRRARGRTTRQGVSGCTTTTSHARYTLTRNDKNSSLFWSLCS